MKRKYSAKQRETGGFFSGVMILSLSTVAVKIIGLAYKIPMLAYLGAEGMGYFNSAAELYAMLCVIATAGLPVALSMFVSAERERGDFLALRRIERSARVLFLLLGSIGTVTMWLFSKPIAVWIGNKNAYLCIKAIAPALFCVCFSSSVRGFFQGLQNMTPTAVSQLIEALGKWIFGVGFASAAIRNGWEIPTVAAFAALGLSLGTFCSALYLLAVRAWQMRRLEVPIVRETNSASEYRIFDLFRIAFPITLGATVLSLTRLSDMALLLRRLQDAGMSVSEANAIYGSYTTLAVPVFSLIPSLITPIALVAVPVLTAAIEARSEREQVKIVDASIRFTVLLSVPAAMGISVYAEPILMLLFPKEEAAVACAAPLLSILGISILFSGLITATNAILQAYRKTVKPIVSMAVGVGIKLITAYILIGNAAVGAYGAPISTLICDVTVTGMNFYFLGRCVPKSRYAEGTVSLYWKPLGASVLSILLSLAVYLPLRNGLENASVAFFVACATAMVAYGGFLVAFRAITQEDLTLFPMGERLLRRWKPFVRYKKNKIKIKDGITK